MKSIVCFGDSNTWGYDPRTGSRFPFALRWTGILQKRLGGAYQVIEEGLCGRTTVWNDPIDQKMSGLDYLLPCLESHSPLDLVIIMLGTNDLKKRFSLTADDITSGVSTLVRATRESQFQSHLGMTSPKVLVLCPPSIREIGRFAEMFEGGEAKSEQLADKFTSIARALGAEAGDVTVADAGKVVTVSPGDGVHLNEGEHGKLGEFVSKIVLRLVPL